MIFSRKQNKERSPALPFAPTSPSCFFHTELPRFSGSTHNAWGAASLRACVLFSRKKAAAPGAARELWGRQACALAPRPDVGAAVRRCRHEYGVEGWSWGPVGSESPAPRGPRGKSLARARGPGDQEAPHRVIQNARACARRLAPTKVAPKNFFLLWPDQHIFS